ncbi:hypothetical protein [Acinetobacter sp.]|uniref:hypothetical protein n=1 Tax=Acinetobacter sp. TaxID=472 RepID=UPI003D00E54A
MSIDIDLSLLEKRRINIVEIQDELKTLLAKDISLVVPHLSEKLNVVFKNLTRKKYFSDIALDSFIDSKLSWRHKPVATYSGGFCYHPFKTSKARCVWNKNEQYPYLISNIKGVFYSKRNEMNEFLDSVGLSNKLFGITYNKIADILKEYIEHSSTTGLTDVFTSVVSVEHNHNYMWEYATTNNVLGKESIPTKILKFRILLNGYVYVDVINNENNVFTDVINFHDLASFLKVSGLSYKIYLELRKLLEIRKEQCQKSEELLNKAFDKMLPMMIANNL